jgi:hypothetical protein
MMLVYRLTLGCVKFIIYTDKGEKFCILSHKGAYQSYPNSPTCCSIWWAATSLFMLGSLGVSLLASMINHTCKLIKASGTNRVINVKINERP